MLVGQQYMLSLNNQNTQIEIKWNSFSRVNESFLFVNFRLWSPNLPNSTRNLLVIYYYLDKWRTEHYSMESSHSPPVKEALRKPGQPLPRPQVFLRLCSRWGPNRQSIVWLGVISSVSTAPTPAPCVPLPVTHLTHPRPRQSSLLCVSSSDPLLVTLDAAD